MAIITPSRHMETPMLTIVRNVRRRLRQQFFRIRGRYRSIGQVYPLQPRGVQRGADEHRESADECPRMADLFGELPQHVGQDAAVAVVFHFLRRVDAHQSTWNFVSIAVRLQRRAQWRCVRRR